MDWIDSGSAAGDGPRLQAPLTYRTSCQGDRSSWSPEQSYDLRVNHPLTIGGTQIFLIGHGYAPVITVRDGAGAQALPRPDGVPAGELELRVVRRGQGTRRKPGQDIGLEGLFYPTFALVNGDPINVMGDDKNPALSMLAYVGDLGLTSASRSRSMPWTRRTCGS